MTNDQTILPGNYELDAVVPSRHIAFEFNGCVWHSERTHKPTTYHRDKFRAARNAGYQLVQIWEDNWDNRYDIVVRLIAHKLGATNQLPRVIDNLDPHIIEHIGARKLTPMLIDHRNAKLFLEQNHIQGSVTASRHYGLIDDNGVIRAVMSIRSPRNNTRAHRQEGMWEIQRYATYGVIPGGFSKLMKFAEQDMISAGIDLRMWISFSANDVSDGSLYKNNGFFIDGEVPPVYYYVGNSTKWIRMPKESYQKRRFRNDPNLVFDESWTEHQAALNNRLYRIYDAGKIRWVKIINH